MGQGFFDPLEVSLSLGGSCRDRYLGMTTAIPQVPVPTAIVNVCACPAIATRARRMVMMVFLFIFCFVSFVIGEYLFEFLIDVLTT